MGKDVVKIPCTLAGFGDNDWEGSCSSGDDEIQYARTRLAYHDGVPIVFMEKVTQVPIEEQPEWAGLIDCGQVGYTRLGKIVAYDFGLN
jgi:hypothetical protein